MKIYKNLLATLTVMLFVSVSAIFTGCEGPEGPAGPAGQDGLDGKDASVKCATCHSDDKDDVNLAFAQFNLSGHANGEAYLSTAGRTPCSDCHSSDGFRQWATGNGGKMGTGSIDCKTCHPIHKNLDETDWALRIKDGFNLLYHGTASSAAVDFKTGNLCATCHQARPYTRGTDGNDTWTRASATAMYSRFGPHYGTAANVISMKGLNLIEGSVSYPTTNPHGNLAKGCVSCHMSEGSTPANGGHTFGMTIAQMTNVQKSATCSGCHPGTIGTSKANEVIALLAEYRQLLVDKNLLYNSTGKPGDADFDVLSEYAKLVNVGENRVVPSADSDALLNYLYIARDRSNGAHNPAFTVAILKNGIEYLKK